MSGSRMTCSAGRFSAGNLENEKMIKSLFVTLTVASLLVAAGGIANAAPKCKAGQVYSEDAGKCVNAPRGS